MRLAPVVPVSLAFAAGAWCTFVALPALPVKWLGIVGVVVVVLAVARWRLLVVGAGLAGVLVAGLDESRRRDCRRIWSSGDRAVIVRIHDAPGVRGVTTGSVQHDRDGCRGRVRLRIEADRVTAGATVIAVGVVTGRGTFRVDHVRPLPRPAPLRIQIRHVVQRRINSLYGPRAPLVEAMVLGRRDDVDPALRQRFVAAGVAHLLAISGLHVGILAAWITLGLTPLTRPPRAWVFGAVCTWLYVALLGFPASATRAAAFISVAAISRLRQRNPGIASVVAVAVIVLLLVDPLTVTSVGAWLSVAAVLGTAAGHRLLTVVAAGHRDAVWMPVARLGAASAGATVFTAPITAYTFGQVAPVGLLTNLVAMPLAAFAVPGMFLSLVLGKTIAAGTGLCLAGLETVARVAASVPGGQVEGPPGVGFAALWVVGTLGGTAIAWRYPRLPVMTRRAVLGSAIAVWTSVVVTAQPLGPDRLSLIALDVGQGDAIVVRTPRGRAVLVDGGPRGGGFDAGLRVVAPALERLGIDALAAVVVSHADVDHLGGIPAVLARFPTELLIEPGQPVGSAVYGEMHDAIRDHGIRWVAGRSGDVLRIDSVTIQVLHPTATWMRDRVVPNENSVVLRISYRGFDALLTGDVGLPVESLLVDDLDPVDVLKVGHHGSRGSTGNALLEAVSPAVAVVSVGRRNRYGHPAPVVLARLEDRHIDIFRTDRGGAVTIETDGRYFAVRQGPLTFLERLLCRVRTSSPSNGSSSSRNGCFRRRPVT